jgi:uncharacterized protein
VIDKDLLEILACPETHQTLREADEALVGAVNAKIALGAVVNVGGTTVGEVIEGGLVRSDGRILYPIRDRIPVLLIDEGIPLANVR